MAKTTAKEKESKKKSDKAEQKAPEKPSQKIKKVDEVKSEAKYIRISPYKVRRVANEVRGLNALKALALLKRLPHKGAAILYKVIHSAVHNATHNHGFKAEDMRLDTLLVNEGPQFKRFQPKGRGRIYQILKRSSHIIVKLKPGKGEQ